MEQQNLFCNRSLSSAAKSKRDEESGQWTEEMVLRIFNYMELIASSPWIYSKCAG